MVIEGYIEKIIYQNEENGYVVFQVETEDGDEIFAADEITAKGAVTAYVTIAF